jgi:hypothetical protein
MRLTKEQLTTIDREAQIAARYVSESGYHAFDLLDTIAALEAEATMAIARAVRDEAKWWRYLAQMHDESYFAVEGDKRLAAANTALDALQESQGSSEERAFRKALNTPAEVWYPCGCTASPGSPRYCPTHGKPTPNTALDALERPASAPENKSCAAEPVE